MYRFFLFCVFILFVMPMSYASRTVVTQNPYYNPYAYNNPYVYRQYYNNSRGIYPKSNYFTRNYGELNALEKYVFNKNYSAENNLARLQRLEMQAFGAIQQGDFQTRYDNVRAAILSRPKAHTGSSVWRNIGDYFAGQITGFTPQINQYPEAYFGNTYPSNYGNSSVTEYSSPFGRGGTRIKNYGTASGAGITILD